MPEPRNFGDDIGAQLLQRHVLWDQRLVRIAGKLHRRQPRVPIRRNLLMMAFAVWRILRLPEASAERRWALGLFIAQLALNAAWSWMFFAANNPLLGLINIVPQILVIVATMVAFYRLDRMAGWCLVPLAAWVSFATVLNFAIWKLNP